ncbi:MAG: response regulator [Ignavibacteria bacterium]
MQIDDLIATLRDEAAGMAAELADAAGVLGDSAAADAARDEAREACVTQLSRLAETAGLLGLGGLQEACTRVLGATAALPLDDQAARAALAGKLGEWFALVLAYLADVRSADAAAALASQVAWLAGADAGEADALAAALLIEPQAAFDEAEVPARETTAAESDVSLELAPDCDTSLLDAFLQEAPLQAAELGELMQKIAARMASAEDFSQAKRIAHTFKGSANIIGIRGITKVAHHAEDLLEFLEARPGEIPAALADVLLDAAACLEQMVYALLGQEEAPGQALSVLQALLDWANRMDRGELSDLAAAPPPAVARSEPPRPTPAPPAVPAVSATPAAPAPDAGQSLRVPVQRVDDLFRLVGELSMKIGSLQARLKDSGRRARQLMAQNAAVQKRIFELEKVVDVRGVAAVRERKPGMPASFDPLELEQYNELHSVSRALMEETADARSLAAGFEDDLTDLATMAVEQDRVKRDLQYLAMSMRMAPVSMLVPRLQRNVRQTCHDTGHQARLIVEDNGTMIDGEILNRLADPLLHVLRNAVDHGIEPADERALLGKPAEGTIRLAFERRGQTIVVRCTDDGRGLDYAAIRARAVERGLLPEGRAVDEGELARIICLPGFSTRDHVSEISGRGVGLDVVRNRVLAMKGAMQIHSAGSGRGTTVELSLPASLVALHALVVRAADQSYAISSHAVESAIAPETADFVRIGDELQLAFRGRHYPVWTLAQLVGAAADKPDEAALRRLAAVLARVDDKVAAIMVDAVVDGRELIVKDLGRYLRAVPGVSGAAIMGDGTVAPALDVAELLRANLPALGAGRAAAAVAAPSARRLLVVDDSLSMRRALAELLEDAGFSVQTARDGIEAIALFERFRPEAVLTDLEMPDMNGLELTAHLRGRPDAARLPIIMITSRSQAKHRQQAERAGVDVYLTKPYSDAVLLDHVRAALKQGSHAEPAAA